MHRREKSAIQRHRREIVDDLFLEEDLLAKMMREKLFTTGMIDDIKVQLTLFILTLDTMTKFLKMTIRMSRDLHSRGDSNEKLCKNNALKLQAT